VDEKSEKKIDGSEPSATRKSSVAALFAQSGEIAPVDVRRFGTRAGEIIARGARAAGRSQRPAKLTGLRLAR